MKGLLAAAGIGAFMVGYTERRRVIKMREDQTVRDLFSAQFYGDCGARNLVEVEFVASCDYQYKTGFACYKLGDSECSFEIDPVLTTNFLNQTDECSKSHTERAFQNLVVIKVIVGAMAGAFLGACAYTIEKNNQARERKFSTGPKEIIDSSVQPFFGDVRRRQPVNERYRCPITREMMKYPVTASDGKNYERAALRGRIQNGNYFSPTGEKLETDSRHKWFKFNKSLSQEITNYLKQEEMLAEKRERRVALLTVKPETSTDENRLRFGR